MIRRCTLLLLIVTGLAVFSQAQFPWSGIIDPTRAADWTGAGVSGGIPNRVTQCGSQITATGTQTTDSTGQTPDVEAINSAIQNCAPGSYVSLGGTNASPQIFYICGGLTFGSPQNTHGNVKIVNNVTLRGGGPLATILRVTCPGSQELGGAANGVAFAGVQQYAPGTTYTMDCAWTAGYAKTTTLITVTGCTAAPALGMIVILDQRNSSLGLSGCTASSTTIVCTTSIAHNYTVNPNPTQTAPSGGTCPGGGTFANGCNVCPDQLTDCVFVGYATDTASGAGCTTAHTCCPNGDSFYNTGCNSPVNNTTCPYPATCQTIAVPITNTTTNTFTYSVVTAPTVATTTPCTTTTSTTTCAGFSDVDNGGVFVTSVKHGTTDETSGTNGRNCPDVDNVNTCLAGEISQRSEAEVKMIVGICSGVGTGTGTGTSACQNSSQIIIDRGLFHNNWASSQAPGMWSMDCSPSSSGAALCSAAHNGASCGATCAGVTTNYAQGDGLENLTIDGNNDGGSNTNSLVEFYRSYGSWMRNVRCLFGDRNCVWIRDGSAHLQFQDVYAGFGKGSLSQSYGIEYFGDISDSLISNGMFQHVPTGIMWGGCYGCVSAYNYLWDDGSSNTTYTLYNLEDLNHDYNGYNLMEGNSVAFCHFANVHGTLTGPVTVFRSRCRGQTPGGPIKTASLQATENSAFNRGINLIGNVLGWVDNTAIAGGSILAPGENIYWGNLSSQGKIDFFINRTSENNTFVPTDPLVGKSLYGWGNYDAVSGPIVAAAATPTCPSGGALNPCGTVWAVALSTGNGFTTGAAGGTFTYPGYIPEVPGAFTALGAQAVPSSHTLPASFYYASQPNFWVTNWGTPSYPAIGPDVSKGIGGGAPDCIPAYDGTLNTGGCMADNLPSQLAANNFSIDSNFTTPNTVTTGNWVSTSGGLVTWQGSFTVEIADTFKLTGTNAGKWDTPPNGQQVVATSGPQRPFQPVVTQGFNLNGVTGSLSGSYYIVMTRVQPNGHETHTGAGISVIVTGPTGCNPGTSCNNSLQIAAPVNNLIQNGGQTLGGITPSSNDAATHYNVYAGIKGTPVTQLCLQVQTAVGVTSFMSSLVVPPCTTPPTVASATASVMQSYLAANPGNTFTTGTMTAPLVLAYDAKTAYPNAYGTVTAATPAFSLTAGTYVGAQWLIITTANGSLICYNTTGSPSTVSGTSCAAGSTPYPGPLLITSTQTVYAVAGGPGLGDSSVNSVALTIKGATSPIEVARTNRR